MRKKIFSYYIILVIIGISISSFFISELTQRYYLREAEEKLKSIAYLIKYNLDRKLLEGSTINFNNEAKNYSNLLSKIPLNNTSNSHGNHNLRITFIAFNGKILGESNTDYHYMENHLDRKEIQEAIKGRIGTDIRHSKTLNIDFMYVAVALNQSRVVVRVSVPLVQLNQINKTISLYALFGIVAALPLTALLAFMFTSSLVRPVKQLIKVSKEISTGNYSKRVQISSKDELGELADTFNNMALQLEKTVADLKEKNARFDSIINSMASGLIAVDTKYRVILLNDIACGLFNLDKNLDFMGKNILEVLRNQQLISSLKETIEKNKPLVTEITISVPQEKYLRINTAPIKSADPNIINAGGIATIQDITNIKKLEQIKTEFVSNVTHELKTPLTSIRGFIETLRNGALEDKNVAEKFLDIIDIEAERLSILINDILQLSEIETTKKDTNIAEHNLKSIVDEVISILKEQAEKKGVTITEQIDPRLTINVNKDRFKQMFINLIDNAIKYNVQNGKVKVEAFRNGGKVVIKIRDTGIGIPKQHHTRIFERFYRVDKGRSRNMGGTGLGLSIVKHIVNLYNGDISVNSSQGSGTEFIIQFPL